MGNFLKRFASVRSRKSSKSYETKLSSTNHTGDRDNPMGTAKNGNATSITANHDPPSSIGGTTRKSVFNEVGMSSWKPPKRTKSAQSTPSSFSPRRQSLSQRKISNFVLPSQEILEEGRPMRPIQTHIADEAPVEGQVQPMASVVSLKSSSGVITTQNSNLAEIPAVQEDPRHQPDAEPAIQEDVWPSPDAEPVQEIQWPLPPTASEPAVQDPSSMETPSMDTTADEDYPPLARYISPPSPSQIRAQILNPSNSVVTRKPPVGIVTLNVNGTPYFIHKDYLTHYSGYFRSALAGPWIECSERHIDFDDDDIEVAPFNILVHWLYTQQLPHNLDEWVKIAQAPARKIEIVKLKALVLADRFIMPEFQRAVNNDLVNSRMPHAPYYELIIYAFANLPPSSPLLRCLVDLHCLHWNPEEDDEEEMQLRPQLPYDFLMRVMARYGELQVGTKGKTQSLDPNDYYIHADDVEKIVSRAEV